MIAHKSVSFLRKAQEFIEISYKMAHNILKSKLITQKSCRFLPKAQEFSGIYSNYGHHTLISPKNHASVVKIEILLNLKSISDSKAFLL